LASNAGSNSVLKLAALWGGLTLALYGIAIGLLEKSYDIAICCYAYHLIDSGWEFDFLNQLGSVAKKFIIITPSKKIRIDHPAWSIIKELRDDKITLIILQSTFLNEPTDPRFT
jgi:hypothetical protein